jgi:hypothetical protein
VTGESSGVEYVEEGLSTAGVLGARDQGREAGYGPGPEGFAGAQVVVEAELELRVPAFFETPAAARDPGFDLRVVLVRCPGDLGYIEQGLVGAHQDRASQHVLDQKRALLV